MASDTRQGTREPLGRWGCTIIAALAFLGLCAVEASAQPRLRYHDETQARALTLAPANRQPPARSRAAWRVSGAYRQLSANGLPNHSVGALPNRGNPNAISAQQVSLRVPASPRLTGQATPLRLGFRFGVSLQGVPFDPMAAEFWHGDRRSGWQYNALGGAIRLGLDANYAHVQPNGAYHYHGLPSGLLSGLSWSPQAHAPLVGFAADGFPIYALTGVKQGQVVEMTSAYRLRSGRRPGGNQPSGAYDGAFLQDYEYVAGAGSLDACNGAFTVSPEYPDGSYAYFLTRDFPVVPLCFAGQPDQSFALGPPGPPGRGPGAGRRPPPPGGGRIGG